MNIDLQPDRVTLFLAADSLAQLLGELARAKAALLALAAPESHSDAAVPTSLAAMARRLELPAAPMSGAEAPTPPPLPGALPATAALPVSRSEAAAPAMVAAPSSASAEATPALVTSVEPQPAPSVDTGTPALAELQADLNRGGQDLFGAEWAQASPWLVKRYTTKFTPSDVRDRLSKLTAAEVADLLTRLIENAPALQGAWADHKKETVSAAPAHPQRRSPRRSNRKAQPVDQRAAAQPSNVIYATG